MKTILSAAANAEIAAMMHWRSANLSRLMRTVTTTSVPEDRREALRMHEVETEAILKDIDKGWFHTLAGIEVWSIRTASAGVDTICRRP
jgi:hypothetical protein